MALATRNLYLVLKARDEASRVVRGFGRELGRAGDLASAQALRQRAQIVQLEQAQRSLAAQQEINSLRNRSTTEANAAAALRSLGASRAQVDTAMARSRALRSQAQDLERANNMANKEAALLSGQLRNQAAEFERAHRSSVRFANGLHQVSATLVTVGSGLILAGGLGVAGLVAAANAATEYQRQVALTKTQTDGFDASLQQLSDIGLNLARNIAVPFEQIQPALYNIFSSTNANVAQATNLLTEFAKAAVAGQVNIDDAAKGTISIMNAFNVPLDQVNKILDIQFQIVRKGVGTYDDFQKVFGRVVPSATRANQSFEEVGAGLAYLTRNGLSAAMASTSFARALDAMSNPAAVKNMEALGIKVRDAKGNMLPLEQSLGNLQKYLLSLPNADRISALVSIFKGAGGTIQARRFLDQVLLKPGELDEYIGFLNDMKNANGQFGQAYTTMSNTVAAQTQLLKNKFDVAKVTIGQIVQPYLVDVLKYLNKIADAFNNLSPATQKWIVIGFALVSILSIVGGIILVVIGALAGIAAAVVTAGSGFFMLVGAVSGLIVGLMALGATFVIAYQKSAGFRGMLTRTRDLVMDLWKNVIIPFAQELKDAFEKYIIPPMKRLKDVIEKDVMPVIKGLQDKFGSEFIGSAKQVANVIKDGLVTAFQMIGWVINNVVIPVVKWLSKYYQEHKETIDMIIHALVFLAKWFAIIAAVITGVLLVVLGGPIIAIIIAFVAVLTGIGIAIVWIVDQVRNLIDFFKHFKEEMGIAQNFLTMMGSNIKDAFFSIKDSILTFFKDAPAWLFDAGKNMIKGLVDGVLAKAKDLPGVFKMITQDIKSFFPFSPAKKGPLSGNGSLYYAGQHMMKDLASGIASQNNALNLTASAAAGVTGSAMASPPMGMGGNVSQTFNISTQEINPRRHSAELGFLLAGRM